MVLLQSNYIAKVGNISGLFKTDSAKKVAEYILLEQFDGLEEGLLGGLLFMEKVSSEKKEIYFMFDSFLENLLESEE